MGKERSNWRIREKHELSDDIDDKQKMEEGQREKRVGQCERERERERREKFKNK
jgi:hypothetical protein